MHIELRGSLDDIDAASWDALSGPDDPFMEYGFLRSLELSGSVGEGTGWLPLYVTVVDGERLVGALPSYVKGHSYGEYIFDWGWAQAARRVGMRYYPKLVVAAPMTPATGRRVLIHPDADRERVLGALIQGVFAAADEVEASGIHWLFLNESEEAEILEITDRFRPRRTVQFHWHNQGYRDFDHYLEHFRSKARKETRRERRKVAEAPIDILIKEGPELSDEEWAALDRFYRDTCFKRGSYPYLTEEFLPLLREHHAGRVVAALAKDGERTVAGTLNFQKGPHLYGRYWGCDREHDFLHFELCYYRLIDRSIEQGLTRFEAGAQGRHKIKRGLMPVPIRSLHWIRHKGLARGVYDFLEREAEENAEDMAWLERHGPFRRGDEEANR